MGAMHDTTYACVLRQWGRACHPVLATSMFLEHVFGGPRAGFTLRSTLGRIRGTFRRMTTPQSAADTKYTSKCAQHATV